MRYLILLLLFPLPLLAENSLSGEHINIDATKSVSICTGTEPLIVANNCTGGGETTRFIIEDGAIDAIKVDEVDFIGETDGSELDPTTDAPTGWIEIKVGGETKFVPYYDEAAGE
jgi:hypothetical protein